MSQFTKQVQRSGKLVWKHTSAFVAVVLIIAALIVGVRIGQRGAVPPGAVAIASPGESAVPQEYTCSMHPSVRLPDAEARCPICGMELIPVTDDLGDNDHAGHLVISEAAATMSEIETARVGRFFPTAEVRLFGKLTYDETSVARITSYFPGRIDRLFVNYIGVPVAKGDHLAEMYSPQLLATFEEVRQARLSLDQSQTTSELVRGSTERTLEAAREKLRLFGLTDEQINAAESGESDNDRLTVFSPIAGVVTHLAAREGDYVQMGSPIATVADLSRLWLDMEAYESQLPMLRWGQAVTFTVEAHPGTEFSGTISFIEPIVDARTRTAAVRIAVENTDARLKPGMFASAVVRPRMAAGGAVISDDLAGLWVGPMHPTIVKDAPGECDICGMDLVSAESLGVVGDPSQIEMPLVIPRTAALQTGTRAIVYVKVPDTEYPTYEARQVVLGSRAGQFFIVEEGLEEGEEVVVNGAFRIDSAMQIEAKPSMMMPSGGKSGGGHQHGGATSMTAQEMQDMEAMKEVVPAGFVQGLDPVYASYLKAQESLASDDLGGFIEAAQVVATAVGAVDTSGLAGGVRTSWQRVSVVLGESKAVTTIEDARAKFASMSESVIAMQQTFGHRSSETFNVAFCPMAFGGKGAEWLQVGTEINNPFYGSAMLRCGDIRQSFEPVSLMMPEQDKQDEEHEGHAHE